MNLLNQIRIAVIGMPDAGKSTFIGTMLETAIGKHLSPDTLMSEVHWSDGKDPYGNPDTRTIKCAKILFKYKDVEFCFYDCPGHIEYSEQIGQGIRGSHCIIKLIDIKRETESTEYYKAVDTLDKPTITLYSHSDKNEYPYYDAMLPGFKELVESVLDKLVEDYSPQAVDVEAEALRIIKETINPDANNAMFFSGGKDSLVGLDLLSRCGLLNNIKVYFPYSGYDFPEVEEIVKYYSGHYGIAITPFDNSLGNTYEETDSFTMLQSKAKANNELIDKNHIDLVSVQYRASDEGVRSKDYHISQRQTHVRFSPVFYFSETNIWRYISKHNLKVCPLYYRGYRSLGDSPITIPCMPQCNHVDDIIHFIDENPGTAERDGRKSQDNSVSFAMEKLRNVGFF